jgi:branched-chain amino acid transport system permease protein
MSALVEPQGRLEASLLTRRPAELVRLGAMTALASGFVLAIGMISSFENRLVIDPLLGLGSLVLSLIPLVAGGIVALPRARPGGSIRPWTVTNLLSSAITGGVGALGPIVIWWLAGRGPGLRQVLVKVSPELADFIALGTGGPLLMAGLFVVLAIIGGAFRGLSERLQRSLLLGAEIVVATSLIELIVRQVADRTGLRVVHNFVFVANSGLRPVGALILLALSVGVSLTLRGRTSGLSRLRAGVGEDAATKRRRLIIVGLLALILLVGFPLLVGTIVNELLANVAIFALMAVGLNIVLGYAGVLNLGSMAFFAVGAYTTAVLTSSNPPGTALGLSWWLSLPIVLALAALVGVLLGVPVIRLRGDYLAIVTLGFSEIFRILVLSDWLRPTFGAAQGIQRIAGIPIGGTVIAGADPRGMFYVTAFFLIISIYASLRLQNSRTGRAWAALREDESTAQSMGINVANAKLLAFVIAGIYAALAGSIFAAKVGTVFPNSFQLIVGIIVVVIVIVGGMGHVPGVLVGTVIMIGVLGGPRQAGILAELGEYKLLIYGVILVYMMLQRPEGLLPSVRIQRELAQDDRSQDAWFDRRGRMVDTEDDGTAGAIPGTEET